VIEVVSPGSEVKDMELSPPFYLLHGVKDVVVFDPRTGSVAHFRRDGRKHLTSPLDIELECGCSVTV
jgi:Uma2 family endonuclease